MHLRKFYILTLFLKLYFFLYTPRAISSPSKASFKLPKKCGHLVIWSFCRFLCFVIGFAANLLKIGGNESRRRTISFSSYSIGLFHFYFIGSVFSGLFPVFSFFLSLSFSFSFFFFFLSFLLSIFIPPTNLQPSCGRG